MKTSAGRLSIFKKKPKKEEIEISLDIPESVRANAFWNICRLDNYHIVSCLIRHCGQELIPFWDALRDCLDSDGVLLYILQQHIYEEVKLTKDKEQLFRVNGGITHFMSSFMRKEGLSVLENYINPIIQTVNSLPNVLEVDPVKTSQQEADQNVVTLMSILKEKVCKWEYLKSLLTPSLTFIFSCIKNEVSKKWPENSLIAIGGFLFLRFINPALVSPQRFGAQMVLANETGARTLILIGKIVQAMANQPPEPFKEEFMYPFVEYVTTQYSSINTFLTNISSNMKRPITNRYVTDEVVINSTPTILKVISSFKEEQMNAFMEAVDEMPGTKVKLSAMLSNSNLMRSFTYADQNAVLNLMMKTMKQAIVNYEYEVNQLNERVVDLYLKLGEVLPDQKTLPEITLLVMQTRLKKLEEFRKQQEAKTSAVQVDLSPKDQLVDKQQQNAPVQRKVESNEPLPSATEVVQEPIPEVFSPTSSEDEQSSEGRSGSDSEEFMKACQESYKNKVSKENTVEDGQRGKAVTMSVKEYKASLEKRQTMPDPLKNELKKVIKKCHHIRHKVHVCNDSKKLYHCSVEFIAGIQFLSGKTNTVAHKNVECDEALIPKTKDLIDKLILLMERKIQDDENVTIQYLKDTLTCLNNAASYLK
ncbi:ras GTP-ase activating protein, putative [Entamoeba invadens IP1]|uniref:Ras GTP-ase activating protein, putative n=1 Tax=Entamoeba invadens IP1 TaxID=370355 RepID=A0A0A1U3Y6_ENTIV|nr:ras GTP-ase activating protein, putative [Entamoeba invadens IP1]ELP86401.1 ras GTP-ase activating protein, putative [Entamoeba invadens IP1]|eukprot:XP_004185747.1 ras GTP-ase activating protein, putative [Entamoeba invadens IP1]